MIFVTVGTHEAPFDRLVRTMDRYAAGIDEPVVVQRGYSREPAPHCEVHGLLSPSRMNELMEQARIIVTHAGPSTILDALALGRVPVVLPRDPAWAEHIDGHQIAFAHRMDDRVIVVDNERQLPSVLDDYPRLVAALPPRAKVETDESPFATRFASLADDLVRSQRASTHLRDRLISLIFTPRGR